MRNTLDDRDAIPRREFLRFAVGGICAGVVATRLDRYGWVRTPLLERGRLTARPENLTGAIPPGTHPLGFGEARDGLLHVPANYRSDRPAPVVLALHGAGGSGARALTARVAIADELGIIVVAPDSRGLTWDVIRGDYGPDVDFIDRALRDVFHRCSVDPARVAISGFSDGATYALSLGLTNGDLFSRCAAFSPGFFAPAARHGTPEVFISHGTRDPILPIDGASRRIVPQLRRLGYSVRYQEFDGDHTFPPEILRDASAWLAAPR